MSDPCRSGEEVGTGGKRVATLALFAYNQEQYVEEAVKAAFAQTYSPLQIILSDDCSSDGTFKIMRSLAESYAGPHQLALNRNERNLGIPEHINRVARLARGEIVVVAAADDLSLPNRVEAIVAEFARSPNTRAVFTGHIEIDSAGEVLREVPLPEQIAFFTNLQALAKAGGYIGIGATFAYHRDCLHTPGPLPGDLICEDGVLPSRAAMLGTLRFIRNPLVRYRVHGASHTGEAAFAKPEWRRRHIDAVSHDLDAAFGQGLVHERTYREARRALDRSHAYHTRIRRLAAYPVLSRLYNACYYSDIWWRRIVSRVRGAGS